MKFGGGPLKLPGGDGDVAFPGAGPPVGGFWGGNGGRAMLGFGGKGGIAPGKPGGPIPGGGGIIGGKPPGPGGNGGRAIPGGGIIEGYPDGGPTPKCCGPNPNPPAGGPPELSYAEVIWSMILCALSWPRDA